MADLSTLAAALKVFYIGGINEQLNQESVLYKRLAKPAQLDATGKSYTYALKTSRNVSAGIGISDGGAFPSTGSQGVVNCIVPSKEITTGLEITGQAIRAAKGNPGAFVNGVKFEVDGASSDMVRSMNRQFHSDGTDALAFWVGADDTSGTNVDDGNVGVNGSATTGNAQVHLEPVETLDLIDATDNATVLGNDIVVTLGAEAANAYAITWSGTVSGSADGDYLVKKDSLGKQLMGIRGIISASNPPLASLQGLDPATSPYWAAQSFFNSGTLREMSQALLQRPLSQISMRSAFSDKDVAFLMSNYPVLDKYKAYCVANRYHVNDMELDGGVTAVTFNNKPWIPDVQCRRNVLYYINPKSIDVLTSSDGIQWFDFLDTGRFAKKVTTSGYMDAYQAFLVFYGNMATNARNSNAVLGDLSESVS